MTEIRCFDDMDQFGAETDDELEDLTQDIYHRLIEAPGSNIDDPARGLGLEGRLSGAVRGAGVDPALANDIEAELRKDIRITGEQATVTVPAPGECRVAIKVVANELELGIMLVADGTGVRRIA